MENIAPEKINETNNEKVFPYLKIELIKYASAVIEPNLKINSSQIPAPTDN